MTQQKVTQQNPSGNGIDKQPDSQRPLLRKNYILMIAAGAMIIAGFLLMLGSSSTTEQFNPDIFSTRRIVIGPTIAFLGFIFMGAAIVWLPRKNKEIQ
ncbi:DUF3098 domain-containing protein [Muribaculum caecicola]|uniref:DUF3098 domain-containing protein n=1 Tax=Muribaculum caecicola TaxID=3038144 RepID=A0AC61S3B7_9BACT|nr:DUF3098 domain-containing protein [Muribaculum caecicola]THG44876.1 DUF3098 domain-containing protein [Muribaculum caecicola]